MIFINLLTGIAILSQDIDGIIMITIIILRKIDGIEGVDIKSAGLSRFQHLSVLIKAYDITKDRLYLDDNIRY